MTGIFPSTRLDEAFDDRGLLVRREESPFSGMTENDQAFDAFEAAEPGAESLDRRVVDLTVAGKRGHGCGNETSEIEGFMSISSVGIDVGLADPRGNACLHSAFWLSAQEAAVATSSIGCGQPTETVGHTLYRNDTDQTFQI